jgi:hypothetical protein
VDVLHVMPGLVLRTVPTVSTALPLPGSTFPLLPNLVINVSLDVPAVRTQPTLDVFPVWLLIIFPPITLVAVNVIQPISFPWMLIPPPVNAS